MKKPWMTLVEKLVRDPERSMALVRHLGRQFKRDQALVAAGMLTYATLLSLVPLTTVVVSIVAAMPGASNWNEAIQAFAFEQFVPAARETIQQTVNDLAVGARSVTAAMGAFLVITSIILMHNIETTINRIFRVQQDRSWSSRFMVYWSALTLGPVLLGASLALSSYFFSLRFFASGDAVGAIVGIGRSVTPIAVSALAFFLIFAVVPNRRVPWRHAALGAVLTALLFEAAKKGFGIYVATFEGYERLYGALAAIPIFLVWIYLSWSIILFGASFTASLNSFRFESSTRGWPREDEFVLLLRLLGHLWSAHQDGRSLSDAVLFELEQEANDEQILRLLENLRAGGIIARDQGGDWLLRRDLAQVSLGDLYRTDIYAWPAQRRYPTRDGTVESWMARLDGALATADGALEHVRDRAVVSFFAAGIGAGRKQEAEVPVSSPTAGQG
ncbi:MAG: YihY family inner membrane protein [Pseudomonadota bacterium]